VLVSPTEQFVRTHFVNEAEIEGVVQQYAEQLFGSSTIYLPQTRLTTGGGRGTVPDAIVIDVEREEWFIVEAERASHGTWEHIAPQVSRQLAAVGSPESREVILHLALDLIGQNPNLRQMFVELGIGEIEIHGRLQRILQKAPAVAIPIDGIPKDLREWVQTLRNTVKIWVLEKLVSVNDQSRILFSIPDENLPTLTTAPADPGAVATVRGTASQIWEELLEAMPEFIGESVFLEYGPRGAERRTFQGIVRQDGIEVNGTVYSPSSAAVVCMKQVGSQRRTANGWIMWKTKNGEFLTDLYEKVKHSETSGQGEGSIPEHTRGERRDG
jgi:hypothetical protein